MTSCAALLARLAALREAGELAAVVTGGAAGADAVAGEWARASGVRLIELRPDYAAHGNQAPHIRNAAVVARAARVRVVWDGGSRGTLSAARHAARLGLPMEWLLAPAPADLTAKPASGPSTGGAGAAGQLGLW